MVVEVWHPGLANISKKEVIKQVAKIYRTKEENVMVYGFRTHFGGSRSTGFAMVYDNKDFLTKIEPGYRVKRLAGNQPRDGGRKQKKETKNRQKKARGTAKTAVGLGKK